jgi:cyclophilin family peptidyl-prolyl cis-trans isomerase
MKLRMSLLLSLVTLCAFTANVYAAEPLIIMETSKGTITIELDDVKAPATCENFRQYVQDGFFDGLIFHRVIPGFMIQGGGFEPGLKKKKTRKPIFNEADNGLKNRRGTLSMARTADINSATAQFFLNVNDNRNLDHRGMTRDGYGYAVFGRVIDGMAVADTIVNVPRGRQGMYDDVPHEDVLILKMYEKK